MQPGPCKICGRTNYPASFGGPDICSGCDCGVTDPAVLSWHNNKLQEELAALRQRLEEAEKLLKYVLSPAFYAQGRIRRDKPIRAFLTPPHLT